MCFFWVDFFVGIGIGIPWYETYPTVFCWGNFVSVCFPILQGPILHFHESGRECFVWMNPSKRISTRICLFCVGDVLLIDWDFMG